MTRDENETRRVIAILSGAERRERLLKLWNREGRDWTLELLPGSDADHLLLRARTLKVDLETSGHNADECLDRFSQAAINTLSTPIDEERILVVSDSPVPLDLVSDHNGERHWGLRGIFSHVLLANGTGFDVVWRSVEDRGRSNPGSYVLVCPMAVDRPVARHLQDIVQVATELEGTVPVEVWLQPSLDRALEAFTLSHAGILHIDTHGSATAIMLGATRDGSAMVDHRALPKVVAPPLVIAVGCELTASSEGIGMTLVQRGARAAFGPFVRFHSLGVAGSEEGEADWYRRIFSSLLVGDDLGHAVLNARRQVATGYLRFCWLTVGSSLVSFDHRGFAGT